MGTIIVFILLTLSAPGMIRSYEVTLNSFAPYADSDRGLIDYGTLRMNKKTRSSFMISGNFTVLQNVGREYLTSFELVQVIGDQSRPIVRAEQNFCQFYSTDYDMLLALRSVSNWPPKDSCPFPKGEYYINGYEATTKQMPPILAPGLYLLKFMVSLNGKQVGGYILKGNVG
ncbi:uncharacterized protein LOC129780600 [Toxorhynchites rutilus septentrionalis]|uniref:uncharacterized protein LOC129780600 n=1 Tax=Toxorhynchites rutilus septentrionalis TaxID=329112 RepID=UPI00247B0646|nr:uncharacterized protein LOC129780600 [Toxorhynchites rutilus septentrionalis]